MISLLLHANCATSTQTRCELCLEAFKSSDDFQISNVCANFHCFHSKCIKKHFVQDNAAHCPCCKLSLTKEAIKALETLHCEVDASEMALLRIPLYAGDHFEAPLPKRAFWRLHYKKNVPKTFRAIWTIVGFGSITENYIWTLIPTDSIPDEGIFAPSGLPDGAWDSSENYMYQPARSGERLLSLSYFCLRCFGSDSTREQAPLEHY